MCVRIPTCIKKLKDTISHMHTSSILGPLSSTNRLNMVLSLNISTENVPTVATFGFNFTEENVAYAIGAVIVTLASVIWNELEDYSRKIGQDDITNKILSEKELMQVREVLRFLSDGSIRESFSKDGV